MSPMSCVPFVSEQPMAVIMDSSQHATEKSAHCSPSFPTNDVRHCKCHRSHSVRRFILPSALAVLVLTTGLLALSYLYDGYFSVWGLDELVPRSITSDTGTNNGSPLVKKKYYLIIIFVGLVVVLGLGIALSFWCCQGIFKNPLCCPCYLCAFCGGITCLECIGCGLCATAMEEA